MAIDNIPLIVSENTQEIELQIDDTSHPYYVGARAYITQTEYGAIVTVIDKEGKTEAVLLDGNKGKITDISYNPDTKTLYKINGVVLKDVVTLSDVAISNDYNDLDSKPHIPTAVSELINDSGFITRCVASEFGAIIPKKLIYRAAVNGAYKFSQGFCIAGDKAVITRTTGNNNDATRYLVVDLLTGNLLNTTELPTLHSNSICYNADANRLVCCTTGHIYTMVLQNDNSIAIESDRTASITGLTAIAYTDGTYYVWQPNSHKAFATTDLDNFEEAFAVDTLADDASQGLGTDGNFLYFCNTLLRNNSVIENRIYIYDLNGEYKGVHNIPIEYMKELEEVDFYNGEIVMYNSAGDLLYAGGYDVVEMWLSASDILSRLGSLPTGRVVLVSLANDAVAMLTANKANASGRGLIGITSASGTYDYIIHTATGIVYSGRMNASGTVSSLREMVSHNLVECGKATVDSNGEATVTYKYGHTNPPLVTANAIGASNNNLISIKVTNYTTTGCKLVATYFDGNSIVPWTNSALMWQAIEPES